MSYTARITCVVSKLLLDQLCPDPHTSQTRPDLLGEKRDVPSSIIVGINKGERFNHVLPERDICHGFTDRLKNGKCSLMPLKRRNSIVPIKDGQDRKP